jgi:hypothetical protein
MVMDLNQAVDISNYLTYVHLNPVKNITETLLGKYKDAVNPSQETTSLEFLQSSRNQRSERNV